MNRDEEDFGSQKFSVVQKCPKCSELSLSFRNRNLICSKCGYTEDIPTVK